MQCKYQNIEIEAKQNHAGDVFAASPFTITDQHLSCVEKNSILTDQFKTTCKAIRQFDALHLFLQYFTAAIKRKAVVIKP